MSKLHVRCDRQFWFFLSIELTPIEGSRYPDDKAPPPPASPCPMFQSTTRTSRCEPAKEGEGRGRSWSLFTFFWRASFFLFSGNLPHADDRTIVHIFILTRMQPLLHCCCCCCCFAVTEPGSHNKTSRQNSMHLTTYGPTIKAAMSSLIEKYV